MAWINQGYQFFNPDTGQYYVPEVYGGTADSTGVWGQGNGIKGTVADPGTAQLVGAPDGFDLFGSQGFQAPGMYNTSGGGMQLMGAMGTNESGMPTGKGYLSTTPFSPIQFDNTDTSLLGGFDPLALGLVGLFAGGFGAGLGGAGASTGGSAGVIDPAGSMFGGADTAGLSGVTGTGGITAGEGDMFGGTPNGVSFEPPPNTPPGMTWDSTTGRYVDPYGNVVDQSPMPGTDPNYTPSTGVTPGYDGSNYPSDLEQWFKTLPSGTQNLLKGLIPGMNGSGTGTGNYSFPFGQVLGGLLDAYGTNQYRHDLLGVMNKSLDYADPFHNQRPQYQDQYRQLTSDPSNFFNDPAIKTAIGLQQDATARKLASQGYNVSGNYGLDVNKAGMAEAFKNYLPYMQEIGTAAGAHFAPGSTNAATQVGQNAAAAGQQTLAGFGAATQSALTGEQPSYLEQLFGAQKNQNLQQLLFSGLS